MNRTLELLVSYFTSMEEARQGKGIFISQQKYITNLLKETRKIACKSMSTPMDPNLKLGNAKDAMADKEMYQHSEGRLIYLSHTRPEIPYTVSLVSQFMHCPRGSFTGSSQNFVYLEGTPGSRILFKRNENATLDVYIDANYAGSIVDMRSITRCRTFLGRSLATWRSKKQSVVARSSVEAEFQTMAQGICESLQLNYFRRFKDQMGRTYEALM